MDGLNCSIRKRFSDVDLKMKTKDVKNLLNFSLSGCLTVTGASLSMAQLQFIEPREGKAFPDKDPNRDCTTPGIFRFNAFSSAGRNVNFV